MQVVIFALIFVDCHRSSHLRCVTSVLSIYMSHASHELGLTLTKKQNKSNKKYLGLVYPIERTLQAGQELDIGIFADTVFKTWQFGFYKQCLFF